MAGFVNGFANRPLAFDEIGFVAHTQRLPFAVDFISEAAALTADFLEEQVLVIAEHAGHAPRHFAVEAAEHHRQTGNRDAGRLIFRRTYLHETPQRRRGQRPVRIAGQQAFAATAALRGDCPVVRSRRGEQVQRRQLLAGAAQFRQPRNLPVELEALQFVGFSHWQVFIRRRRAQPGEFVSGHGLREHQRLDFLRQVGRLAEIQQGKNQRRIFRFPVFGLVTAGGEVARQLVGVAEQVGVDAPCIHLEEALEPWRRGLVQLASALLQIDRAHVTVGIEHRRAGHFRQPALGQQAQDDHLVDTVAGVDVTETEQRVMEAVAFDQRHAHRIAPHRNVLRQALERLHAGGRWQAVLGVPGLATGQAENTGHCCGNAEPGKKM